MFFSAVNHSYDSNRTIKIISGIITMSAVNHIGYDSKRTIKIISGIITMTLSAVDHSYDSNRTSRISQPFDTNCDSQIRILNFQTFNKFF